MPTIEVFIGMESNKLEEVELGLIHKLGQVLDVYADSRRGSWERLVRPVLQDIPARWLEEQTGLSRRTIQRLRNGHSRPREAHEATLTRVAAEFALQRLREVGGTLPKNKHGVLSAYLAALQSGAGVRTEEQ